jgi:hypothetical protein
MRKTAVEKRLRHKGRSEKTNPIFSRKAAKSARNGMLSDFKSLNAVLRALGVLARDPS